MEGVLLKWTNYLSGWQPRWFVLDNGNLSYYKSQEDVNNGCKGSIKMAVCDIVVHQTDMSRLDLTIPGEQHYYVKAGNPQDRQSWLIALGSSKASFSESSAAKTNADALPDQVRVKKSELRLYCDLLMQQVHSIKEMAQTEKFEPEKLTESASMIGVTCDTFIATLEDCIKLVANTPMIDTPHQHVRDAAIPHSPTRANVLRLPGTRSTITTRQPSERHQRQTSTSSADSIKIHTYPPSGYSGLDKLRTPRSSSPVNAPPSTPSIIPTPSPSKPQQQRAASLVAMTTTTTTMPSSSSSSLPNGVHTGDRDDVVMSDGSSSGGGGGGSSSSSGPTSPAAHRPDTSAPTLSTAASSEDLESGEDFKDAIDAKISTFFSTMKPDFSGVAITEDKLVPVTPFLDACTTIVPLFDKLNSTAFAPVKMDFSGNIRKLQQKQLSNPEVFTTLQAMVSSELEASQYTHSNSATSALLWLKRSLEFIREFLREFSSGSLDLSTCASNAYHRTLKNFHGWVVRGVFAVAVKALPYRHVFVTQLYCGDHTDPDAVSPSSTRQFEEALLSDIEEYIAHLDRVITVISDYYMLHALDSTERV